MSACESRFEPLPGASSPRIYRCTKDADHSGLHVAPCGRRHIDDATGHLVSSGQITWSDQDSGVVRP